MIDTLFLFTILGLAVPIVLLIVNKLDPCLHSQSGRAEDFGERVGHVETWILGDFSFKDISFEEIECRYCGTLYPHDVSKCPNCYAPRRREA